MIYEGALCGGLTCGDDGLTYVVGFDGASGSSTYYEHDGYEPNHFIYVDGELKPMPKGYKFEPKRCPHCGEVIEE